MAAAVSAARREIHDGREVVGRSWSEVMPGPPGTGKPVGQDTLIKKGAET